MKKISASSTGSRTGCRSARVPEGSKKKPPSFDGDSFESAFGALVGVPATRGRRTHLLEAGAAVDRLVAGGWKRHACSPPQLLQSL